MAALSSIGKALTGGQIKIKKCWRSDIHSQEGIDLLVENDNQTEKNAQIGDEGECRQVLQVAYPAEDDNWYGKDGNPSLLTKCDIESLAKHLQQKVVVEVRITTHAGLDQWQESWWMLTTPQTRVLVLPQKTHLIETFSHEDKIHTAKAKLSDDQKNIDQNAAAQIISAKYR